MATSGGMVASTYSGRLAGAALLLLLLLLLVSTHFSSSWMAGGEAGELFPSFGRRVAMAVRGAVEMGCEFEWRRTKEEAPRRRRFLMTLGSLDCRQCSACI